MDRDHRHASAVNITPRRLDLPIFMLSRNRIKQHYLEPTRNYISRNRLNYTSRCKEENHTESKSIRKLKEKLGYEHAPSPPCPQPRLLRINRSFIEDKPWHLPPNRYDPQQFHSNFQKSAKPIRRLCNRRWPPNEKPQEVSKSFTRFSGKKVARESCLQNKWEFLRSGRNQKPTSRNMVTDPAGCCRDPDEPAPNHYNVQNAFVKKKIQPINKLNQRPNPHLFLPHTSIPVKPNACHPKDISFEPGPGRYEKSYGFSCHCRGRLIFMPDLQLLIEREKRNRFRRKPYKKIKVRNYCSNEFSHVAGHGFRYLFKRQSQMTPDPTKSSQKQKAPTKSQKDYHLYPEARYIGMINDPTREVISWRLVSLVPHEPPIKFNCLAKKGQHRISKTRKNAAFNSTADRFKGNKRAPSLTVSQQEHIKSLLPLDRQLRNHPVMRIPLSDIKAKLFDIPKNRMECPKRDFRRTSFQFKPLPPPKALGHHEDIRPEKPKPLFDYAMDPQIYFKDNLSETNNGSCSQSRCLLQTMPTLLQDENGRD